ncbi:MAG: dihydrofolate reductase [Sphingobacteriales bacterium]
MQDCDEVMVIGGATIYEQFLPQASRLYITFIDLKTAGDTQFPDYKIIANWQEVQTEAHQSDAQNNYNYQFVTLDRVS